MAAWLVTWERPQKDTDGEDMVAAVLNYRYSAERVRRIVELIYANSVFSPEERLSYAQTGYTPYPAAFQRYGGLPYEGKIECGANPWLYARLVDGLRLDVRSDGSEVLVWAERPLPDILRSRGQLQRGPALDDVHPAAR